MHHAEVNLKTYQATRLLKALKCSFQREVEVLERDLNEIQRALSKRRTEKEASERAGSWREESKVILNQLRSLQERIQEQDRDIARKTAQLNVLEGLQAKFEGFGEGAKAILGDKLSEVVAKESVAIISKELKVQAAYTKAIETLLGPAMEALFVGKSDRALGLIGKLDEAQLGRACLQIDIEAAVGTPRVKLPESIVPAASVVNVRDKTLFNPAQRLLSGCYFADDLKSFI